MVLLFQFLPFSISFLVAIASAKMHAISLFDKLSQWHEYLEVSSLL
jgi:hypothetical protein